MLHYAYLANNMNRCEKKRKYQRAASQAVQQTTSDIPLQEVAQAVQQTTSDIPPREASQVHRTLLEVNYLIM